MFIVEDNDMKVRKKHVDKILQSGPEKWDFE